MKTSICVVFALAISIAFVDGSECPSGWTHFGTECYVILHDVTNWYESRVACDAVGGKLAEISSGDENNFIANLLSLNQVATAWIGLEDLLVEGRFVWSSNRTLLAGFNGFPGGQAPHDLVGQRQDCVFIRQQGDWNDDYCRPGIHVAACQQRAFDPMDNEFPSESVVG